MKNENAQMIILTIIMYPLVLLIGLALGNELGTSRMQKAAIEAEVAGWKIDAKTGERTFEYKKF